MREAEESARRMIAEAKREGILIVETARIEAERIRVHDAEVLEWLERLSAEAVNSFEPMITRLVDLVSEIRTSGGLFDEQLDSILEDEFWATPAREEQASAATEQLPSAPAERRHWLPTERPRWLTERPRWLTERPRWLTERPRWPAEWPVRLPSRATQQSVLYWAAVAIVSLLLVVGLVFFLESRDISSLE